MRKYADVIFISGSMFGKKSRKLIDTIKVAEKTKSKYIVLKPTNDTRDGLFIKSRDYEETIPALPWDNKNKNKYNDFIKQIKKFGLTIRPKIVFLDEAHFLSVEDMKFIIGTCKNKNIILIAAGLETDFKHQHFPSTRLLKECATKYKFFHGKCKSCGEENAVHNILFDDKGNMVKQGKSIQPGDSEYNVFCEECFRKETVK